jgi:hypothetical protein
MKILVTAHTLTEEGAHYPGEVVDLPDELAAEWIERQWAIKHTEKGAVIETPETGTAAAKKEDASLKRRQAAPKS